MYKRQFPYLTIEKQIFFFPTILFAATNNLSEHNFVAPYKFNGFAALSVDKASHRIIPSPVFCEHEE